MAKSSLLESITALEAAPKSQSGFPCRMREIYAAMTKEDAAAVERVISNKNIAVTAIMKLLKTHGHEVGTGTLYKHRRRLEGMGCKCPIES